MVLADIICRERSFLLLKGLTDVNRFIILWGNRKSPHSPALSAIKFCNWVQKKRTQKEAIICLYWSAVTVIKHLAKAAWRRNGLFWLTNSGDSIQGWLVSLPLAWNKTEHHSTRGCGEAHLRSMKGAGGEGVRKKNWGKDIAPKGILAWVNRPHLLRAHSVINLSTDSSIAVMSAIPIQS